MKKVLMKGNEALGEATVRAGCDFFCGYPITPQSELPQYLAHRLPEVGKVFLQAESEVAAINMAYGAAGAGARVMTSSSGPGISLKSEGISYMAGAELPVVIVNVMRGGPGLGNTLPAQADYAQATRGGGHGDYHLLVLAPYSVQEIVDLTMEAFELADQYRTPVMVLSDGILGQIIEPVVFPEGSSPVPPPKPWATTGKRGHRSKNIISSLHLPAQELEDHNFHLKEKFATMAAREARMDQYRMEGAELAIVAYGSTARIAQTAVDKARQQGIAAGLLRPISLWPFPAAQLAQAAAGCRALLVVEMSMGQMVDDVSLAVRCQIPVHFHGRTGGMFPMPSEIVAILHRLKEEDHA